MAEPELIQDITINAGYVHVKFERTLKISSITNNKFLVATDVVSPVTVTDPFKAIVLSEHYNSISRELTLYWNESKLAANTAYTLTFHGLQDSTGATISDTSVDFSTGSSVTPTEDQDEDPRPPDIVIDHSIAGPTTDDTAPPGTTNQAFYVTDTDPDNGDYFIDENFNNGRITIKFNAPPSAEFINKTYFKAQSKKIQRAPTRWSTVTTVVSKHSSRPWVFVDFPSSDATPVYTVNGKTYFAPGYKYRIIVSKDIST